MINNVIYRVDYTTDDRPLLPEFEFEDASGKDFTPETAKRRAAAVSKRKDVRLAYAVMCVVETQTDYGVIAYANGRIDNREGDTF